MTALTWALEWREATPSVSNFTSNKNSYYITILMKKWRNCSRRAPEHFWIDFLWNSILQTKEVLEASLRAFSNRKQYEKERRPVRKCTCGSRIRSFWAGEVGETDKKRQEPQNRQPEIAKLLNITAKVNCMYQKSLKKTLMRNNDFLRFPMNTHKLQLPNCCK